VFLVGSQYPDGEEHMTLSVVAAFLAVDVLLVLTPGADWAYAIATGLGGRAVLPAVAGLVTGYAGYTLLVVAGLAVLVARTPGLLTVLTVLGAVYLLWLGYGVLARPSVPGDPAGRDTAAAAARSPWRVFARGAGVSGLNPKGLLLYLALLPQFARPGPGWPVAAQIGLLGVLHMSDCAVVYSAVAVLARLLLGTRVAAARALARVSGAVMIAVGAALLIERLAG
jgi:threonine/homoserine/homoserine lactone efflux protein